MQPGNECNATSFRGAGHGWRFWIVAVAPLALLWLLGRSLSPDPRGFGTHEVLALPACPFRSFFARPCPLCGATTALAHLARAEWSAAWIVHPLVTVLLPAGLFLWLAAQSAQCAGLAWPNPSLFRAPWLPRLLLLALLSTWLWRF